MGYSGARLRRKLQALYPNAAHQSIRALANRSIAARRAARRFREGDPTGFIDERIVPQLPGAEAGTTVGIQVTFYAPNAENPSYAILEIKNAEFTTLEDLLAQAQMMAAQGQFIYPPRMAGVGLDVQIPDLQIIYIIRG